MSTNTLNSGSLQGLQMDQTLMVSARKVAGAKVQLEFAEILQKDSTPAINPLAVFNKSDSRFAQTGKARRAWMTVEPVDASEYLGIDLSSKAAWVVIGNNEILELNVLNPVATINGQSYALKVEIRETTEATEWQADNLDTAAKRRGKDGAYCTHKGLHIFSNAFIAFNKANHVFLEMDAVEKTTSTKSISAVTSVNDSPFN
jgi:hypothetical protein